MNKDEQLARLLRMKRHEKPPADYFEGFLEEFHACQRKAPAMHSAARLWWAHLCNTLAALRSPSTAWAAAGAFATVMVIIAIRPAPDLANLVVSPAPPALPSATKPQPTASSPDLFRSRNAGLPIDQTITVSDSPGLKPPAPGKRRTADQPQNFPNSIGPAPSAESKPKTGAVD